MNIVKENIVGKRYGKWVVLSKEKYPDYVCRCDCGTTRMQRKHDLITNRTTSCGCSCIKHGMCETSEHNIWRGIKDRCFNKRNINYRRYGAKGISICDEWKKDFNSFFNHIGKRPSLKHSVDRIDNNRGYEPGNVRWATKREQSNNTTQTIRVEFAGIIMTNSDWADVFKIKTKSFCGGIKSGLPVQYYIDKYLLGTHDFRNERRCLNRKSKTDATV